MVLNDYYDDLDDDDDDDDEVDEDVGWNGVELG